MNFQCLQSSRYYKAHTEEDDSVLLSESLEFSSKMMAILQDDSLNTTRSGHSVQEKMEITWVTWGRGGEDLAPPRRILLDEG